MKTKIALFAIVFAVIPCAVFGASETVHREPATTISPMPAAKITENTIQKNLQASFVELQYNFIKKAASRVTSLERAARIKNLHQTQNPILLAEITAAKQKVSQLNQQTAQTIFWLNRQPNLTTNDIARLKLQLRSTKSELSVIYDLLIQITKRLENSSKN